MRLLEGKEYKNDNLYKTDRRNSESEERIEYARKLREYFISKMLEKP